MRFRVILALMQFAVGVPISLATEAMCTDCSQEHMLLQFGGGRTTVSRSADHNTKKLAPALGQYESTSSGRHLQQDWYSLFWCPPHSHQNEAYQVSLSDNTFVPVLASHPPGNDVVTQAIIVVHGAPREAEGYFESMVNTVHQQKREDHTLVIAPAWADKACSAGDWSSGAELGVSPDAQAPYWTSVQRWMYGGPADLGNSSSFEVLDRVVDWAQVNYPHLRRLVVTGFSAGAQFLIRWAAMSPEGAYGVTMRKFLPLVIIASSPSTFLYLSEERPDSACVPDEDQGQYWSCNGFSVPSLGQDCDSKWNQYASGLGGLHWRASSPGHTRYVANKYLQKSIDATSNSEVSKQIRGRWATKDVRYLFGAMDTKHCDVSACSNECEHMLTGKNRLQRGLNFVSHLKREFHGFEPLWGIFNFGHDHIRAFSSHYFITWALPYANKKYRVTDRVVVDKGAPVGDYVDRFYAAWECMDKCDRTSGCHSFMYIPIAGQCFLKDRCVDSSSPIVSPDSGEHEYQTYWKPCVAA